MNPEIAKLYKWSVLQDDRREGWIAKPLVGSNSGSEFWFSHRVPALNHANQKAKEAAGNRVLMALLLAAVQGVNTLG